MELNEKLLQQVITPRPIESHKGTYGKVVLIGGNEQFGGAIIMSALAAVHSGAGLTTVVTDPNNHVAVHSHLPEAMVGDWTNKETWHSAFEDADVLLIGPGLGTNQQSLALLQFTLTNQTKKQWIVIDGSALTLLATHSLALPYPEQTVLTPHQMEWQRVSGLNLDEQTQEHNQQKQQELGAFLVLKSHQTTIYGPKGNYPNPAGSPAMATGGMGDTLAGMIAGFLAQFPKNEKTISAAVYLHSFIGDQLAKEQYVVLPTQISKEIPKWMHYFSQK
ncbi:NAD(P)H-hydrate dehydratase [Candidatus Enterococcus mangumiae]|uniref:ADP-dependent (S)-NAD(P)H-hydrate dehydratase n=1 Tax=Candidatus Enterococcus mangumiae TaxID=2230878 RepID=A0ABZ2SZR4_9ENTE|nr:NAD(P)H-hydrate dehydratase [Enterococcus sp. DIV1094]MBO0490295.1 NAD(P)H-hydrate dehydratase [Enterococcus sp. DIV1094]